MAAHCFFFENLDNRYRKTTTYQLQNNTWISCKSYISKQTVWTHPSITQSFNHRENITKQLFCFQLRKKVRPKRSSKSLNSSFLSATSTKQPTRRNLTALHPGKFECSLSGKDLPQTNLIFFYKSLTRLQ